MLSLIDQYTFNLATLVTCTTTSPTARHCVGIRDIAVIFVIRHVLVGVMALDTRQRVQDFPKPKSTMQVLIDEAQDVSTEALKFLTTLFESDDPEQQDLLVVADNAQRIFDKSFTWKSAGISAQGRTNVMRRNYRNTYEIIDFAHKFLIADPNIEVDADDADGTAIIPVETTERHGKPVDVRFIDDQRQMIAAIIQQVTEWKPEASEPRSIAVLMQSQTRDGLGATLAKEFERYGIDAFWVGDPDQPKNKDNVGMTDSPVVLSTIHSAKGLEFPNVIATGITGDSTDPERMVRDRKTLYVGFTRAVNELVVLSGRDTPFGPGLGEVARTSSK